ncbi:hypothetical protein P8452_58896 [Trifolium repens]|nr:hypothetical protein P8452_58896 [Trifolium repens]
MKGSLISLVLTALLVINSLFQPHQNNKLQVAADSTYENILSASVRNNTDEGANGCTRLQCGVIEDDEADLFIDQQATRSSRMLAGMSQSATLKTLKSGPVDPCSHRSSSGRSSACIGGKGSPQLRNCKDKYCDARVNT